MGTVFFIASKLVGLALLFETWLVLGLVLTVVALFRNRPRRARLWGTLSLLAFLAIGVLPFGALLLRPLEAEFPPREAPPEFYGVVVLGGFEDIRTTETWGQPQVNDAGDRLIATAALALQNPDARIVMTGGNGRLLDGLDGQETMPVATHILTALGVNETRITWESRSRNTTENASLTFDMVAPAPDQNWVFVTSAFHMGRALASFERAGWPTVIPFPVDYRTYGFELGWSLARNIELFNLAAKEHVGRIVYRLTGR